MILLQVLQDMQPNLRHQLPGAWRLLKTWHINEIPNRAPPLPEHIVHALAGRAFFHGWNAFGVSLLLGFYTMLRTGELLALRSSSLTGNDRHSQILVSLGLQRVENVKEPPRVWCWVTPPLLLSFGIGSLLSLPPSP